MISLIGEDTASHRRFLQNFTSSICNRMNLLHYGTVLMAFFHSGIVEKENITVEGISAPVYYVYDESWSLAGQGSAFSHIIINRAQLEGRPDLVHDFIFLHEAGHKQWAWPLQSFFTIGQIAYLFLLVVSLFALPALVIRAISVEAGSLVTNLLAVPVSLGVILVIPLLITWFDEAYAELHAISQLGLPTYLEVQDISRNKSRSLSSKIRSAVMYPPNSLILAIFRYRSDEY